MTAHASPSAGNVRVLVVEDEPLAAEAHAAYTQRVTGFEVVGVAHSATEAARMLGEREVDLVINTPRGGPGARADGYEIRAAAVRAGVPCMTTIEAGQAAAAAIASQLASAPRPLQDRGAPGVSGGAFRPGAATV